MIIHLVFQIGGLIQTLRTLILFHVVVTHLDGECTNGFAIAAHSNHQSIGHLFEGCHHEILIGLILGKRFLLSIRLGRSGYRHNGTIILPCCKGPNLRCHTSQEEMQQIRAGPGKLPDTGQACRTQSGRSFGANTGQPVIGKRMKKRFFITCLHRLKRGRLV